jgi:hypothetical protein
LDLNDVNDSERGEKDSMIPAITAARRVTSSAARSVTQSILIVGPAVFDHDVPALDVAGLAQALAECGHVVRIRVGVCAAQDPITGAAGC